MSGNRTGMFCKNDIQPNAPVCSSIPASMMAFSNKSQAAAQAIQIITKTTPYPCHQILPEGVHNTNRAINWTDAMAA